MSDRMAVFNQRPDRADRRAGDVYERPATRFVAGFVGTSNLLDGRRRRAIVGTAGTFTVRPEKIHLAEPDAAAAADEIGAPGTIREVVYLGPETRYIVELEAGRELVVTQQNLTTSSTEALAQQGRPSGSSGSGSTACPSRTGRAAWRRSTDDERGRMRGACGDRGGRSAAGALQRGGCAPGRGGIAGARACRRRSARAREPSRSWPGRATSRTASTTRTVDWVTEFEDATGCEINVQVFGTSDEAFTLFSTNPEQFDVISASGDASLRLVRGGFVQPVNVDLIPSYADIFPALKNKPYNTVDGVRYGVPHGRGSNLLMWRTDDVTPAPTNWAEMFDPARRSRARCRVYDAPIYIADAAVLLMATKPELGIKNPYALDDTQFAGGGRPAQAAEADDRPVLGRLHQADGRVPRRRRRRRHDLAGHHEPAPGRGSGRPGRGRQAQRGRDRLVRHLDDQLEDQAYELRLQVHQPHHLGPRQHPDRRVVRRGARQLEGVRAGRRPGPLRHLPRRRRRLLGGHLLLADPEAKCVDGRTDVTCKDFDDWVKAWTEIKG